MALFVSLPGLAIRDSFASLQFIRLCVLFDFICIEANGSKIGEGVEEETRRSWGGEGGGKGGELAGERRREGGGKGEREGEAGRVDINSSRSSSSNSSNCGWKRLKKRKKKKRKS